MNSASSHRYDATDLLDADHVAVEKLFDQFNKFAEGGGSSTERKALADRICFSLSVHTQLEEESFYPQVREATGSNDIINEAEVEHEAAKKMIAEISGLSPDDLHYNAKVKVLGEMVRHHIAEERSKVFPTARKSDLDLVALAAQLRERKEQIVGELSHAPA